MKKQFYLFLLVFYVLILKSCSITTDGLLEINLKIDTIINQLSDSTFFTDIRSIYYCNNKYFISDYKRDQILVLNNDLQLISTLGSKGNGPGELSGASHLYVINDSIFLFNDYKRTIELYNLNGFVKTIKPSLSIHLSSNERYFEYKNELYLTNVNEKYSISKYNYLSDSVVHFGLIKQYRTPRETKTKNRRHLLIYQDYIIAIPVCQPAIEMYNIKGELIKQVDLSNIKPITNLIKYNNELRLAENSFLVFFPDVYLYKNKLLITFLSIDENNKRSNNTMLEFEINNQEIIPKRILRIDEGWFGPICITENHILTYTSRDQLISYLYE